MECSSRSRLSSASRIAGVLAQAVESVQAAPTRHLAGPVHEIMLADGRINMVAPFAGTLLVAGTSDQPVVLADRDPETRENRYPALEMVRLTIPRRVYTRNHMDYVAEALGHLHQRAGEITSGYRIAYEPPIMRHFTVELEKT